MVKNNPRRFDSSHHVTLSAAKGLSRSAARCFAALSMTGLDLSLEQELSSSLEPCLKLMIGLRLLDDKDYLSDEMSIADLR